MTKAETDVIPEDVRKLAESILSRLFATGRLGSPTRYLREIIEAEIMADRFTRPASVAGDGNHKLDTDQQVFFYEQDFYVLSKLRALPAAPAQGGTDDKA